MVPLLKFLSILVSTFCILTLYSYIDYEMVIPEIEINKSKIKKIIIDNPKEKFIVVPNDLFRLSGDDTVIIDTIFRVDTIKREKFATLDSNFLNTIWLIDSLPNDSYYYLTRYLIKIDTVAKKDLPQPMDTTSQRVLLIGDSMLEGLRLRLRDYCGQNNHDMRTVIWYSSQTKWYGESDTLAYFIKQYKPTYVLLVLGANELFVRNIKERRQKYVKHIVEQLDTLQYVWIGPPNWKDDTGINELILENVGKKKYYPSLNLKYKRASDGAHPTHSSAAMWMDSVASWIMRESFYPIKMEYPEKKYKGSTNTTILKPLR